MRQIAISSAVMGLLLLASQVLADPQSVLKSVNLHLKPANWQLLAEGSNGPRGTQSTVSLYIDTNNFQELENPWIAVHTKEVYKPATSQVTSHGKVSLVDSVDALNCETTTDIPVSVTMYGPNHEIVVQKRLSTPLPRTSSPNAPSFQFTKINCGMAKQAFAAQKASTQPKPKNTQNEAHSANYVGFVHSNDNPVWHAFAESKQENKTVRIFYDQAGLERKQNDWLSYATLENFIPFTIINGQKVTSRIQHQVTNCRTDKQSTLAIFAYDTAGKQVEKTYFDTPRYVVPQTGTIEEVLRQHLCKQIDSMANTPDPETERTVAEKQKHITCEKDSCIKVDYTYRK
ncbi:MAG: hypothetical protein K0Q50_1075 [Vampirovibrio sp.]|jgi:hypothetical protein|nr:hypothetical protein [Vampirovibrio sp.]